MQHLVSTVLHCFAFPVELVNQIFREHPRRSVFRHSKQNTTQSKKKKGRQSPTHNETMMEKYGLSKLLLLVGVLSSCFLEGNAKVKRVKAGQIYNEHDPVHIVVNKVG